MKILNLLSLFIFVFHSSTWAAKPVPLAAHDLLQKVVEKYNSMSQKEKQVLINDWIEAQPEKDKSFLQSKAKDLSQTIFPEIEHSDGSILFEIEDKKFKMDSIERDFKSLSVNGVVINLTPGKMEKAFKQLEKYFGKKEVSLFDIIIPSAHAFFVLPLFVIFGIIEAMLAIFSKNFTSKIDAENKLKTFLVLCNQLRDSVAKKESLEQEDMDSIADKVRTFELQLKTQPFFISACPSGVTSLACKNAIDIKDCLKDTKRDLKLKGAHINGEEKVKDGPELKMRHQNPKPRGRQE